KAANEKMKKAKKITQASGRIKDTKAVTNRMFATKSKGTSQKSVQRAANALEKRVEQLEEVDAPKEEQSMRPHQSKALQLHNKFPRQEIKYFLGIEFSISIRENHRYNRKEWFWENNVTSIYLTTWRRTDDCTKSCHWFPMNK